MKTIETKRAKEIARLEKERAKPKYRGYLAYFIFVITVVYICDEIASQINVQMQSIIASQVFVPIFGEEVAIGRLSLVSTIATLIALTAFGVKPLSDRFGRRPFLVINTLGMGVGMLLVGIATNIPVYAIGAVVINFFTPHDVQAIYILESTPPKYRATIYSIIKSIATLGMFLIPLLRKIFITAADMTQWRMVYLIPAAICIAIGIAAFFCIRESDAYIDARLRHLNMSEEERKENAKKNNASQAQGGFIKGLKFAISNKQTRWVFIASGFITFGMLVTQYYDVILNMGYTSQLIGSGMDTEAAKAAATDLVTEALLLFSVGSAIMQLIPGFIADKIGRKGATITMSTITAVSFVLFYIGANQGWTPYVVGLLCGAAVGAYWAAGDMVGMMGMESAPTNLRASVFTSSIVISGSLTVLALVGAMILINLLGDAMIATICLSISVPGMLVGLLLLCFKTKETKGLDLSEVNEKTFE